ncbi:hypothetical protein QWZ10_23245 [Paracoccus cavernae]|uniref:NAD(P)-binding domain-containing protein n=1 Tax=Paracoccus cavernae TaxID=1571207 RepID=A0ABT8DB86_9RHOB|nr:hypothetical protein [Paracoccus cavernae]
MTVDRDPRPEAEQIAEAVAVARGADIVIAALGEAKEHAGNPPRGFRSICLRSSCGCSRLWRLWANLW